MTRKRQALYPEGISPTTPSFTSPTLAPHPTPLSNIVAPAPINPSSSLVVPATIWQQIAVNPALTQYLINMLKPNTESNGALTN
ncbi:unnamed protein product [Caenorhabditis nigoni]